MRNVLVGLLVFFVVAVGGCTLMVGGQPLFPQPQPPAVQAEAEMDYVGNTTPLVVETYPGVAFYPRYVDGVIVPVAFINGRYVNAHGVVIVHQGPWIHPPAHVIVAHKEEMRRNPAAFRRVPPNHPSIRPAMERGSQPPSAGSGIQKQPPAKSSAPAKTTPKKKCPPDKPKC